MGTSFADVVSQGEGEILYQWALNLGLVAPSKGKGELMALIANAAAAQTVQGTTDIGPTNAVAVSMPRLAIANNTTVVASGTLFVVATYLTKGTVINSFNYLSGGTAGATLNHQWGVLANSSYVVVAVTPDATNAAIGGNAVITYNLTTAYTVPASGLYYFGIMVSNNAGTQPTFAGATALGNAAASTIPPISAGTSNTGASTPVALGATLTTPTPSTALPYYWLT